MKNAQPSLSAIVPSRWRSCLSGKSMEKLQEIHLRLGRPPLLQDKCEDEET